MIQSYVKLIRSYLAYISWWRFLISFFL